MALLISPNVYQPSSHYPTSLIMQDPCLHQCSFEQSLTKCPCESRMYNLTGTPTFPTPTQYLSAHSCRYVHNLDLHKHPIWAEARFLRLLLKAPSVAGSLGAPVLCGPTVSGLKISSWLPLQGGNLGRTSL